MGKGLAILGTSGLENKRKDWFGITERGGRILVNKNKFSSAGSCHYRLITLALQSLLWFQEAEQLNEIIGKGFIPGAHGAI